MIIECFYRVSGSDERTNKKHSHENCYELIQPISSGGNFVIKDTVYSIQSGTIFLINAIDIHCSVPSVQEQYIRNKISFNSEKLDRVAELLGFGDVISNLFKENNSALINLTTSDNDRVDNIFADICNLYNQGEQDNTLNIFILILNLLQICFDCHIESRAMTSNCVSEVLRYINDNISEDISLSQMSKELFVTKNHLCKQFKIVTDMTVSEYIKARRISIAKKKLQFSSMSISEISLCCGISNSSYFSKLFKEYEGITPTEYRNKYRK